MGTHDVSTPVYILVTRGTSRNPDMELFAERPNMFLETDQSMYIANINGGDSQDISHEFRSGLVPEGCFVSQRQWDALAKAESSLYDGMGTHAFTDVHHFGDEFPMSLVAMLWNQAYMSVEAEMDSPDTMNADLMESRTAYRVSRTLAVLAFGPEFIIR